jgi:hypothetical protein
VKAARLKRHTQWFASAKQLGLAYDFIEVLWPKALSERGGAQRIGRTEGQRLAGH